MLGLWEAEPRDFIFLFFGPQPLVLPGIVELPDGLILIGEGTGLSVLPQATEEQVVIPPGNPPILEASLQVGSDSRLSGFIIEQNGAGANLDLREVQNVILENLEFQRPEVDPPFSHLFLTEFTGLLEVQSCFFSGQNESSEFGSIFGSVPSGQAVIRIVNSELSEDTFQLRAGPGTAYLGVDLRGNLMKGGLDVVLDNDSTGDVLLEANTLRGRAGFHPGLAIGHGDGAGGEVQFRNNLWDDCGPINFSAASTATGGRIALLDDNRFTGGQAGQANYNFFGGTYQFVYHDNRRLDPTEDGQDTQIRALGATANISVRVSESVVSNGFDFTVFNGNLAIGALNNTSLTPLTSSFNFIAEVTAGVTEGIQARVIGNILESLNFQGGITTDEGVIEVEDLADIGNINTVSSTPGQSGNVENLTPDSVLVPPASVPPIEFPF